MQYKCEKCEDTGSTSKHLAGNLDCTSCSAATDRAELEKWLNKNTAIGDQDSAWLIHQRALAIGMSASVEDTLNEMQPGGALHMPQEPVAHLKFWAAQSWSGCGDHGIEHGEGLEVCEPGEIGADGQLAFPVFLHAIPGALAMAPKQEAPACPECDGRGFTYWGEGNPGNGFDVAPEPPEQECCQLCGGSGIAPPDSELIVAAPAAANGALTDERAAFESDTLDLYPSAKFNRFPSGTYTDSSIETQWGAWQRRSKFAADGPDAALELVRGIVNLWDSQSISPDDYNEAMCEIEMRMRALSGAKGN